MTGIGLERHRLFFADNLKRKGVNENRGVIDELMRRTFHRDAQCRCAGLLFYHKSHLFLAHVTLAGLSCRSQPFASTHLFWHRPDLGVQRRAAQRSVRSNQMLACTGERPSLQPLATTQTKTSSHRPFVSGAYVGAVSIRMHSTNTGLPAVNNGRLVDPSAGVFAPQGPATREDERTADLALLHDA